MALNPEQKITLLGLGRMGQGIAISILKSGRKLMVWNRSKEKAVTVLDAGAIWADSPAKAVKDADMVIAMLADDIASNEVWLGENGVLQHLRPGAFLIECSTLSLGFVRKLSATAHSLGLRYIDCPVTGVPDAAVQGKLTLLVGAHAKDLDECRSLLGAFSRSIRYFGNIGSGTKYKLIINLMGAVQIAGLAECIAMAEKLGLNSKEVMSAIEDSAAASPQVVRYVRKMGEKEFSEQPSFTVRLRHKDAVYALQLAKETGFDPKLGIVAQEWFAKAMKLYSDKDEAFVVKVV